MKLESIIVGVEYVMLFGLLVQFIAQRREANSTLNGRKVFPYVEQYTRPQVVLAGRLALANIVIVVVLTALASLRFWA